MRKFLVRIFVSIALILITFDIAELIVRRIRPQITFSEALSYSANYFSNDPYQPFTLPKNIKGQMNSFTGDYFVQFLTNSQGYRGKEFSLKKPDGMKRILFLGDSMTFGLGVSDSETYPAIIESILSGSQKNLEVINAGYADGFSPDSYYVYLKNRGLSLSPDIIIVGFFVWNDITDLSETIWEKTDENGLPLKITSCCRMVDNGILRNRKIDFEYQFPVLRESHLYLYLVRSLRQYFHMFQKPTPTVAKRDLYQGCVFQENCMQWQFKTEEEKTYKVLAAMKKLADSRNIPFYIVLIPVDIQLYTDSVWKYGTVGWLPTQDNPDGLQKRIGAHLDTLGIQYLNLYPVFDTMKSRGYPFFVNDAHLNALGNRITAEAIAEFLRNHIKYLQ